MRNWLITGIFVLLILVFGVLIRFWEGFAYFVFVLFAVLSGYWIFELIYSYNYSYKKNYDEKFRFYVANIINSTNLTSEDINNNLSEYKKKFNKTLLKEKLIECMKVVFCIGVFIASVVLIFTY